MQIMHISRATYEFARKVAMRLRISVSLMSVSSNPGVSIKVMVRPERPNGCEVCTSVVQDLKLSPTWRCDPLTRLMNYTSVRMKDPLLFLNDRP